MMLRQALTIVAIALLCWTGGAIAKTEEMASGFVVVSGSDTIEIETSDGRRTYVFTDDAIVPAELADGDFVLVRVDDPSQRAEQIIIVDERVEVVGEALDEAERAVVGTVTATSTDQLLVETPTGGQAFVIDPEKLFPPLPEPNQRVVVTYRTLEIHPPMHMATGLILLPADFQLTAGAVRETSEPMQVAVVVPPPPPAPIVVKPAPPPAPVVIEQVPQPEPERVAALPQTATPLPLALMAGVLLVSLGVASRFTR